MGELVRILNGHVATPPRSDRLRRWVGIGGIYVLAGQVVLRPERVRRGDADTIELAFACGDASVTTAHHQLFRLGALTVTPRAVRYSSATRRPVALLLEFGGDPAAFHHAIEVAA